MKIGPVDIRNHEFSRKMRGVDEGEVRAYLDLVADQLEEVILESEDLRAGIARLEARLEEYGSLENSLKSSLVSAQQLADERIGASEREARIILKNAEVDAQKVVVGARGELARLRADIDDLRRQKVTYVERFRALLRSQTKILEASIESLDPDDPEPAARSVRSSADNPPLGPSAATQPPLGQYLGERGLFSSQEAGEPRPGEGG